MNRSLVVSMVLASLVAADVVAQRVDLPLEGFRPFPESEVQLSPPWLVITTSSPIGGGAKQCVDLQGAVTAFGGIAFVPQRLGNGLPNLGRAGIGILPFAEPGCTGAELDLVPAAPVIGEGTARDVEFPIAFSGQVPAAARSAAFVVVLATDSAAPFQICLRGPWMNINNDTPAGAPDLDPDVWMYSAELQHVYGGSSTIPDAFLRLQRRIEAGSTLPRGQYAVCHVDVTNRGTAPAINWRVVLVAPSGWSRPQGIASYVPDCDDFVGSELLTHQAQSALLPGQTRRLCVYLWPGASAQNGVQVSVRTYVDGDANPGNDSALGPLIVVEAQRQVQTSPSPQPLFGNGRRR